jgi:hypothetical protein
MFLWCLGSVDRRLMWRRVREVSSLQRMWMPKWPGANSSSVAVHHRLQIC